jgi:formylglycine-generating enzyme required for sulfatase activity
MMSLQRFLTLTLIVFVVSVISSPINAEAAYSPLPKLKDCAECPELVVLPSSSGTHGNSAINSFAIGKYEITQSEWFAIMGTRPSEFRGDRLPVETISWRDAKEFSRRLSIRTGHVYRLPTEEEWEFAARAGTSSAYYFGEDPKELDRHAWYLTNAGESTHPVGQKAPNSFGLYDIHGNVWEWTDTCMPTSTRSDLVDDTVAKFIRECHRVYRGGSLANKATSLKVEYKQSSGVGDRYFGLGLRIVREVAVNK